MSDTQIDRPARGLVPGRVLVTGASGMIGRRFVERLGARPGIEIIRAVGPRSPGDGETLDMLSPSSIAGVIDRARPDVVVHLAGLTGAGGEDPSVITAVNETGTATLAECAARRGTSRFVFASSAAVYGDAGTEPFSEESATDPGATYGRSKANAESLLHEISQRTGLNVIAARIFNVYGSADGPSLVDRLIRSRADSPVTLRNPDRFVRDYVHIDDLCRALECAVVADVPEGMHVVNIATGIGRSSAELLTILRKRGDVHVAVEEGGPTWSVGTTERAEAVLGYRPPQRLT